MGIKEGIKKENLLINRRYSLNPNKYLEKEGIIDIGSNFWNQGKR